MATFKTGAAFNRELSALQRTMERELQDATRQMAEKGEKIAVGESYRDLGGDDRFSGWSGPRLGDLRVRRIRDGALLSPTRGSAGAWTVAERGRNQGNASGFQGPGVNRRTGLTSRTTAGNLRKVRAFQSKRWNGRTRGKGTASRAVAQFEREVEPIADKHARKAIARHFD